MKTCTVGNGGSPEWVCVVDMRTATARTLASDPWGKTAKSQPSLLPREAQKEIANHSLIVQVQVLTVGVEYVLHSFLS